MAADTAATPKRTLLLVGHLSKDVNIIKKKTILAPGGGIYFCAIAAAHLGLQVKLITKCAEQDIPVWKDSFDKTGVEVTYLPSPTTTSCENNYPTDNPDDRRQRMLSLATPFTLEDLAGVPENSDIVEINSLWYGEFPEELIPVLRKRARVLVADAQSFLRHVVNKVQLSHRDWAKKHEYLKYFDYFKIDKNEGRLLTGSDNIREAAKQIHQWGAKVVIATEQEGVCVYDGQEHYYARFGKWKMEGRTGRGDTVTASFLAAREGRGYDLQKATRFAAAITTEKMNYPGPYQPQAASL